MGEGWLIFDLPEGDLGIHPTDPGQAGGGHDVSFYCDDIHGTVADLKSRGVEFAEGYEDGHEEGRREGQARGGQGEAQGRGEARGEARLHGPARQVTHFPSRPGDRNTLTPSLSRG